MRNKAEIIETACSWKALEITPGKRTCLLYLAAALIGALAWSGNPRLNALALLFPFLYLHAARRIDTACAIFYYAASTWSVLPGSSSFFRTGHNPVLPAFIWVSLVALSSIPWLAFYSPRFLPGSAVAALAILAIPPLGLLTVTHPLLSSGQWFPGTRWFGLLLPLALLGLYNKLGPAFTVVILLSSTVVTHDRSHSVARDPRVVTIDTRFGDHGVNDPFHKSAQEQDRAIQEIAVAHPNAIVLFPESTLPAWNPLADTRWQQTLNVLTRQHTAVLLGTTVPIPGTEASQNILLSQGFSEHLSYVQRVPIPLGMWHLGDQHTGYPLMLKYPSGIRLWNHRAAVLVCYEQLLVWPALTSFLAQPESIFAPSNLYWATGTRIPAIQHLSAQDLADLWAIPLYEATNR